MIPGVIPMPEMGRNNPAAVASYTSGTNGGGTTMTVNMPSGIQKGDVLLILLGWGGGTATATGWTNIAVNAYCQALYRLADGTEGASVTVSVGTAGSGSYVALRIVHTSADMRSSGNVAWYHSTGTGTTITPTDILPSWGSDEQVLVIATAVPESGVTVSAFPFPNHVLVSNSWPFAASWGWMTGKDLQPGNFTISASATWVSLTLGLH